MLSSQQQRSWRVAAGRLSATPRRGVICLGAASRRCRRPQFQRDVHVLSSSSSLTATSKFDDASFRQHPFVISVEIQRRNQSSSSSTSSLESTTKITAIKLSPNENDSINNNDNDNDNTLSTGPEQMKSSSLRAYSDLAKAKLSALVVSTTAVGFVAAGGPLSCPWTLASCCIGTALLSSSAAAWNQIIEVDRDQRMKRTQTRPLVQGTLTTTQAQVAAVAWGVAGTSMLIVGTNPVTATLGVANLALYAGLYTYMKPHSIYNTWVGAVVGAIPPLMGWTAAASLLHPATTTTTTTAATATTISTTSDSAATAVATTTDWFTSLDMLSQQLQYQFPLEAWWLAGLLYLWQMPHFLALSYMHRIDYRRGGFAMVSTVHPPDVTAKLITRYTWYLTAMPFVAYNLLETTSMMFAMEGILLNAYALRVAYKFQYDQSNANARHVFLTSLWYLPSLLMLYLLHSKVWDDNDDKINEATETTIRMDDTLRDYVSEWIHGVRSKGRQVCVHEQAAIKAKAVVSHDDDHDDNDTTEHHHLPACPIVVGKHVSHNGVEVAAHASNKVAAVAAAATVAKTSLEGVANGSESGSPRA